MQKFDVLPGHVYQMKILKQAADGEEGVIALVTPLARGGDLGKAVVTQPSANADSDKNRLRPNSATQASLAQRFVRLRRQREKIFGSSLFAEPAWDMLLDLFIAQEKRSRPISITSLCIASAVPPTTALRWIGLMVEQGLFIRYMDPFDARRVYVRLADETWQKMNELLSPWAEKT